MNERTARTNEAETEVELTAVDLVALAVADVEKAACEDARERSASSGRKTLLQVALPTGFLVAAVAAGSALYTRDAAIATQRVAPEPAPVVMPDWDAEPEPEPAPVPEPVRFSNPFDKTEVFEFPAGTTKAEARDAVAHILMERATERRAVDPKLRKKHEPK